jgi:hypothetical protein
MKMRNDVKHLAKRLMVMLPLFLILMGFGIACENSLMLSDEKAMTPNLNNSSSTTMLGSSLPHTNLMNLDFPVTINYEVESVEGSNNPGPYVNFSGLVTTASGFGVNTIFRNNMKGTHEYEDEKGVEVSLFPVGKSITIPKQPSRGGVGGNPYLYIQFEDVQGNAVSEEIFIGRIVQGASFKGSQRVINAATTYVDYTIQGCSNSPGPNITFDAGMSLEGLNCRIIFRNNPKGTHEASEDISSVAQVIADKMEFSFPKQPVLGGVGGNPWIWTQFTDGNSRALSDEILLGRCEQLDKALN